jgi:hypothetical protein
MRRAERSIQQACSRLHILHGRGDMGIRIGVGIGLGQKYPPIVARKVVRFSDRLLSFCFSAFAYLPKLLACLHLVPESLFDVSSVSGVSHQGRLPPSHLPSPNPVRTLTPPSHSPPSPPHSQSLSQTPSLADSPNPPRGLPNLTLQPLAADRRLHEELQPH